MKAFTVPSVDVIETPDNCAVAFGIVTLPCDKVKSKPVRPTVISATVGVPKADVIEKLGKPKVTSFTVSESTEKVAVLRTVCLADENVAKRIG